MPCSMQTISSHPKPGFVVSSNVALGTGSLRHLCLPDRALDLSSLTGNTRLEVITLIMDGEAG